MQYRSIENVGNLETAQQLTVQLDKIAPEAFTQFDPANNDLLVFGRTPFLVCRRSPLVHVAGLTNIDRAQRDPRMTTRWTLTPTGTTTEPRVADVHLRRSGRKLNAGHQGEAAKAAE